MSLVNYDPVSIYEVMQRQEMLRQQERAIYSNIDVKRFRAENPMPSVEGEFIPTFIKNKNLLLTI